MTPALVLALALMTAAPPADDGGEPLPPGAPTDSYELAAWCYGALGEYLQIYDRVKPDLRDIDHMFGTSVIEDEPYQSDMAAARVELKLIGDSVGAAEKASDHPITDRGVGAMHQGQMIWSVVEAKTRRELARAWLSWGLPDRCDSNARELATRSIVLGRALRFNTGDKAKPPPSAPELFAPLPDHDSGPAKPSAEIVRHAPAKPPAGAAPAPPPSVVATQTVAPTAPAAPTETPTTPPAALVATQPPPATTEAAPATESAAPAPQVVESGPPAKPEPVPVHPAPAPTTASASSPPVLQPPNPDQVQEPTL